MNDFRLLLDRLVKESIDPNEKEVAVLLSGGVDSLTLCFSLEHLGFKVIAYSFKIKDIPSNDAKSAESACSTMGWKFNLIEIPTHDLEKEFIELSDIWKCQKKTQFECTWPFLYIFPKIKEKYVMCGVGADSHYGLSKKAMINFRHTKEKMNQFRKEYFSQTNPGGWLQQQSISNHYGKIIRAPYLHKDMIEFFMQFSWEEINKPKEKQMIIDAYPEFFYKVEHRKHANMQIVAGVREVFETLLDSDLNVNNRSRVMDLCRDYAYKGGFFNKSEFLKK